MSFYPAERYRNQRYPTKLNKRESKVVDTSLDESVNVMKFSLSYTDLTDGTAVEFGNTIPLGAIVAKCYGNVRTAFSGNGDGSSTISIGINSAVDIQAATAISGAPYSTTGMKAFKDGAAGNMIIVTADAKVKVQLDIAATDTALDAGVLDIYVEYVNPIQS